MYLQWLQGCYLRRRPEACKGEALYSSPFTTHKKGLPHCVTMDNISRLLSHLLDDGMINEFQHIVSDSALALCLGDEHRIDFYKRQGKYLFVIHTKHFVLKGNLIHFSAGKKAYGLLSGQSGNRCVF